MSPFEVLMLLCFGSAWPFSIYTSIVSRSTRGKNPVFLVVLLAGYTAGILHKLFYSMDAVIILYCLNWIMIAIDSALYVRNRRLERVSDA
ncbi:hypothetical protein WKV44_09530 [Spirochaetia bacterium 38H-sp]|uniref:PQ-loop repeat-containing protein n=1 Tax=Rarispira pelagica TaxID=3141764 RepID=A0ABU9UDN6_9SPIR